MYRYVMRMHIRSKDQKNAKYILNFVSQRGDEILQVNNRPFTNITHDKAVNTLKSNRKMTLTLAHVGKIPADLTYEPTSSSSTRSLSDKSTCVLQMIEEKARTVLTKSEHSRFTFYRLEYGQGFLPLYTFVRILLELLNTHEKVSDRGYYKLAV
jgi:hypothetical protein